MKAFGFEIKKPSQQEMLVIGLIVLTFLLVAAPLSEAFEIDPPHVLAFAACVFAGAILGVCGIQPAQGWKAMLVVAGISSSAGFSTLQAGLWISERLG